MKKLLALLLALALCAPARAVVFLDNFTGTNGTALTAHTPDTGSWTSVDSTLQIQGNALTSASPYGFVTAQVVQDPSGADVSGTMVIANETNHYKNHAMRFRWDTSGGAYYECGFEGNLLTLGIVNPGTSRNDQFSHAVTETNGNHTVRVDVTGSGSQVTIVFRLDGVIAWEYDDTFTGRITSAGKFGIRINSDSGSAGFSSLDSVTFDNANPNLTTGTANVPTATDTQVNLSASAATGGAGSYTYRWHRSETQGFTPDGSNTLSALGAYLSFADTTAVSGKLYYYALESYDGTDTVYSAQVAGRLWKPEIKLGFIGDSITGGYDGQADLYPPGVQVGVFYSNFDPERIVSITHGDLSQYGGTLATPLSGHVDWQPGGALYDNTKAAFTSAGVTHVIVTLGTNDALYGVAAADYGTAIGNIVADLVTSGFKVIVNCPTGQNPAFPGLPVDTTGLIADYPAQIKTVIAANPGNAFLGDEQMRYRLLEHPELWISSDGTHLYQATYDLLAQFWAGAIYRVLNPQTITGGGSGIIGSGFLGF